jgi:pimeloyl-ACP methyl ester carboxylesterase
MAEAPLSFAELHGTRLAVRRREGSGPALFFLPGYASDMEGAKALAVDAFAEARGLPCIRFDYSGTGSSPGEFANGTLEAWLEQTLAIADRFAKGPIIPVGSSMGGWIALHLALQRPARVKALVGIAAAPDFTQWGFGESQKQQIAREGLLEEDNPYGPEPFRTYREFWESGQRLRLLDDPVAVDCPVRLVHGDEDPDVPLDIAMRLMRQLRSPDVQLNIVKGGGHRLSEPHEIAAILGAIAGLLE